MRAWASDVTITLPRLDGERLKRLLDIRRDEQATDLARKAEKRQRDYLQNDVLASPGSAAVWWLSKNAGDVEKCVGLLGIFEQLSAAANQRTTPIDGAAAGAAATPARPSFEDAVEVMLAVYGEPERRLMADGLAALQKRFDRPDLADRIAIAQDVVPLDATVAPSRDDGRADGFAPGTPAADEEARPEVIVPAWADAHRS